MRSSVGLHAAILAAATAGVSVVRHDDEDYLLVNEDDRLDVLDRLYPSPPPIRRERPQNPVMRLATDDLPHYESERPLSRRARRRARGRKGASG